MATPACRGSWDIKYFNDTVLPQKKNDQGETPAVSPMLSRGINERIPSDNSHQLSAPCLTCSDCHQPNTLPSVFSDDPLVRRPMRLGLFRVLGPPAMAHLNLTQAS